MERVFLKGYPPEFVPPYKGAGQAANFDAEFTGEKPQDSHVVVRVDTRDFVVTENADTARHLCRAVGTFEGRFGEGQFRRLHLQGR